jgi:hypothetical protein
MWKPRLPGWNWWPALPLALLIALAAWGTTLPKPGPNPKPVSAANHNAEKKATSPDQELATYTFWLTAFTGVLAVVGGTQGWLIREQIKLAARDMKWAYLDDPGEPLHAELVIEFVISNRGTSPCKIVESVLSLNDKPWTEQTALNHLHFARGGFHKVRLGPMPLTQAARSLRFLSPHRFRGEIIYADDGGERRRYVFNRMCARDSDAFLPTDTEADYND